MSKSTKSTKLPVPWVKRCQLPPNSLPACPNAAFAIVTRSDGTKFQLCQVHARKLRDQINRYPDRFAKVRISPISKH